MFTLKVTFKYKVKTFEICFVAICIVWFTPSPPFILPPNYLQLPETIVSLYNRYTSLTSIAPALHQESAKQHTKQISQQAVTIKIAQKARAKSQSRKIKKTKINQQ